MTEPFYFSPHIETLHLGGDAQKAENNLRVIRLIKQLDEEGRIATPDEQTLLTTYTGWGDSSVLHHKLSEVVDAVTEEEWDSIQGSTLNAHYTTLSIIRAMWSGVMHLGAGKLPTIRILDPSAGIGHFFSAMPDALRGNSRWVEIELDKVTAKILKHLHPDVEGRNATFNDGFQNIPLVTEQFDLVISNIPFGNYPVIDRAMKDSRLKACIHDYFFARAVALTRPGGVIAFITSRYTLDKRNRTVREWLAQHTDLLGAVRLPDTAFLSNAGTEVVTDILFLQKRYETRQGDPPSWADTQEVELDHNGYLKNDEDKDGKVRHNLIYCEHPEWMVGRVATKRGMYSAGEYTVKYDGDQPIGDVVAEILEDILPEDGLLAGYRASHVKDVVVETTPPPHVISIPDNTPLDHRRRLEGLREVYDAARKLLDMEVSGGNLLAIAKQREALNDTYDSFVSRFGPITNKLNQKIVADSAALPFLLALELDYQALTNTAQKARIFYDSTIRGAGLPEEIKDCQDAFLFCLNKTGGVDIDWIASLAKVSVEQAESELAGRILWTPEGHWEIAEKYLSGNIVEKLHAARAMVAIEPRLKPTIDALTQALPKPLKPNEIKARLGSGWIPTEYIEDFVREILPGVSPQVTYIPKLGTWKLSVRNKWAIPAENTTRWGTERKGALELLEMGLDAQTPVVYDEIDDKRVINKEATIAAQAKLEELKAHFVTWLWKDSDRAERLAQIYNERFNVFARPNYNGSHLTFPGLSLDITPRQLQKDAIWFNLQNRSALVGDEVGLGKTLTAIISAMEARRLGFARKAMFVVPNHLTEQWREQFLAAYPNAKVLCAGKDDLSKRNRLHFMSRIATGGWDAVIVPQSSFKLLPVKPETMNEFIEAELDELRDFLHQLKSSDDYDRRAMKEIQKAIKRFEAKLVDNSDMAKDSADTITWEQLGIDLLAVDEFHCLPYEARVLTDCGLVPIGEIVAKRLPVRVKSVDLSTGEVKWMPVTGWFNNPQSAPMVRVVHERGVLECTANHKVWTEEEGYVEAGKLTKEHTLKNLPNMQKGICFESTGQGWTKAGALFTGMPKERCTQNGYQTLPAVRKGIYLPLTRQKEQRQEEVLRDILCCQMANGAAGTQGADEGIHAPDVGSLAKGTQRQTQSYGLSPYEGEQPQSNPRMEEKNVGDHVRTHIPCQGREWNNDSATGGGGERVGITDGVCHPHQSGEGPIQVAAELLQGGHCRPSAQAGDRDRWSHAQHKEVEVPGPKEDGGVERSRVVRVTFLESESGFRSGSRARGDQRVYCLEVAGTHNFFAEGVLVSNCYKNLYFHTKMTRIAGLPNSDSQRAFDMFVKVRDLLQRGKRFIGLTGTPLTNTMAEIFTMQRYFQYDTLVDLGLSHFDSWAQMFADAVMIPEMTPDGGGFRVNTRLARFTNIPELASMLSQFMIMRRWEQVSDEVERPLLYNNKPTPVKMPGSKLLKEFVKVLAERAEEVRSGKIDPKDDNMLKITGEGRKAALDMRLLFSQAADIGASKINTSAWVISEIYRFTEPHKSAQLVFCDLGTPKPQKDKVVVKDDDDDQEESRYDDDEPSFKNVYADLKAKLVNNGVRADEIAFIHDAKNPVARVQLFESVRKGRIRILIGSTEKMGTGMNVQTRAIAMHHLDAPWRPADLEQRDGRLLRQGNIYREVFSFVYITEGSFDAYVWQILETKARFIAQFLTGNTQVREMDDVGDTVLSMAEIKALASGNPKIIERVVLQNEVVKLENLRASWQSNRRDSQRRLAMNREELGQTQTRVGYLRKAAEIRDAHPGEKFIMKVNDVYHEERRPAGTALIEAARVLKLEAERTGQEARKNVGAYKGFTMWLRVKPNRERSMRSLVEETGSGAEVLLDYGVPQVLLAHVSDSDTGTVMSIDATIRSIDGEITKNDERVEHLTRQVEKFNAALGEEWEHASKLETLAAKLALIDKELIEAGVKLTDSTAPISDEEDADAVEEIVTAPAMESEPEPEAVVDFALNEILDRITQLVASTTAPEEVAIAFPSFDAESSAIPVTHALVADLKVHAQAAQALAELGESLLVGSQRQMTLEDLWSAHKIDQAVKKKSASRKSAPVETGTVQLTLF